MNIEAGARLGPYQIVSRIGAGGMGEVFKARDTRLDRNVAIKVLPAELAHNAQLRSRFDREARTISQLNHPNICTLYDVGDSYLVMELLEGETLADVIARGPLPLSDVFRYGIQIAEALDRAHRAGIVHRDLKPGNIMITKGAAKLLDFGLAKYTDPQTPAVNAALETEHKPLTQEGTLLGTFQYMAPEQLDGAEADARADLFALGAVLYEMATGMRAFTGKTRTSLIAAIVKDDPRPISQLRAVTPPAFEHLVSRCLEKDADRRWQSAWDVAEELRFISLNSQPMAAPVPVRASRSVRGIALAAMPWVLLAALAAWHFRPVPKPVRFASIVPPPGVSFDLESGTPTLSPDGQRIVFVALDGSARTAIHVFDRGSASPRALAGTTGGIRPFWSPDGTMLAFFAGGKLKTIPAAGGPSQIVADAPDPRGGAWSRDGWIVYNATFREGLVAVRATGGTPRVVTKVAPGEISHRWPAFLPDGKHVLFLAQRAEGGADADLSSIDVVSLDDGKRSQVVQANSSPLYAKSGHLLYWRDATLFAQRFDSGSRTVEGVSVVVATEVSYSGTEAAIASVADDGTLLYQAHGTLGKAVLKSANREGTNLFAHERIASFSGLRLSRDGRRVVAMILDRGDDLRIFGWNTGTESRLTFGSSDEVSPVWSPDDSKIVFSSNVKDGGDIYVINSSGGTEEPLWVGAGEQRPSDWSRDGTTLLAHVEDPKNRWDIWTYSLADKRAEPWLQTPFDELEAVFSPDGKWIAYTSDESGREEVYVQSHDRTAKWQISRGGGQQPRWRADGAELFYLRPDDATGAGVTRGAGTPSGTTASIFAVDLAGGRFDEPRPKQLFSFLHRAARFGASYDVSADGKTFHLNTAATNSDAPLTIVENWTELLKER